MQLLNIFIILACLGILDSIYLLYKNRPNKTLTCPLNSDCHAVLSSKWNKFLGVKNEAWGLLYYIVLIGISVLSIHNKIEILLIATSLGFLYSLFLTYIQVVKIKEYCLYCLLSALINLLLFLSILAIY